MAIHKDFIANENATVVDRLEAAGAALVDALTRHAPDATATTRLIGAGSPR